MEAPERASSSRRLLGNVEEEPYFEERSPSFPAPSRVPSQAQASYPSDDDYDDELDSDDEYRASRNLAPELDPNLPEFAQEDLPEVEQPEEDEPDVAAIVSQFIQPNGTVSTFRDAQKRRERLQVKQLKEFIANRKVDLEQKRQTVEESKANVLQLKRDIKAVQKELEQVQYEHDTLAADVNKFSKGDLLRTLQSHIINIKKTHQDLTEELQRETNRYYESENSFAAAEIACLNNHELEAQVAEVEQRETMERALVAELRARREVEATHKLLTRQSRREEQMDTFRLEQTDRIRRAIDQAREGRRGAVARLQESAAKTAADIARVSEYDEKAQEQREQAQKELNRSMALVQSKMKSVSEQQAKKRAQEYALQEAERIEILNAGGNPHEVFRQRVEKKRIQDNLRKAMQEQKDRETVLAEKLVKEDLEYVRQKEAEKLQKAKVAEFLASTSQVAVQERLVDYMKSMTGGKVVLDPTGRGSAQPSAYTAIKDRRFGLGTMHEDRPDVLARETLKFPDVKPDQRWLPKIPESIERTARDLRASASPSDLLAASSSASKDGRPLSAKDKPVFEDSDDDEELVDPEFTGMWKRSSGASMADLSSAGGKSRLLNDGDEDGLQRSSSQRLNPGKLTKLQQQYMQAARQRQRDNIVQKQVVCGKEFQGTAFLPKPTSVQFLDFDVGDNYNLTFTLTNISYGFNTFKVLNLPEDIRDFFEISYKPPGHMSAGIACPIHVRFSPKLNQDITTVIPILAETGPMEIPLICRTKKLVLSIDPPMVDLGEVVLAEHCIKEFFIVNDGALDTDFEIVIESEQIQMEEKQQQQQQSQSEGHGDKAVAEGEEEQPAEEGQEQSKTPRPATSASAIEEMGEFAARYLAAVPNPILDVHPRKGRITPYSRTAIRATFFPKRLGPYQDVVRIKYTRRGQETHEVLLSGYGAPVSLSVDSETVNLKTCYYNTLYREILTLVNRGHTAMKTQVEVPPELQGSLEFHPALSYVQANDTFQVQVRFRPHPNLLEQASRFVQADGSSICVPIRVRAPDQSMPVYFNFCAQLTTDQLTITPSFIDFGRVSIDESLLVSVHVHNPSLLAQDFGFIRLPREVAVTPHHGFATILPGETIVFQIAFSPTAAVEYDYDVICRTAKAVDHIVKVHAIGQTPVLRLSPSVAVFPPVAVGDTDERNVILTNVTHSQQTFELLPLPAESGLVISPMSGVLAPGQSRVLLVEYFPTITSYEHQKQTISEQRRRRRASTYFPEQFSSADIEGDEVSSAPSSPSQQQRPKSGRAKSPARPPSADQLSLARSGFFEVPLPSVADDAADEDISEEDMRSSHVRWRIPVFVKDHQPVFLEARTTATQPVLICEDTTDANASKSVGGITPADFGEVAVSRDRTRRFTIRNNGPVATTLCPTAMDVYGVFQILGTFGSLPAGGSVDFLVRFSPIGEVPYEQNIVIKSSVTNNIRLPLLGKGVNPVVQIDPDRSLLDLGDVLVGDSSTKSFRLINKSAFELPFRIITEHTFPINDNGLPAFTLNPSSGTIAVGGEVSISATYLPDRECEAAYSVVKICVENQTPRFCITGRAWSSAVFSFSNCNMNGQPIRRDRVVFETKNKDEIVLFGVEDAFAWQRPALTYPRRLELQFGDLTIGDSVTRTVEVGNVKQASQPKPVNGEFALDALDAEAVKNGFSVDPVKGPLEAGGRKTLTFKFTPTQAVFSKLPIGGVDISLEYPVNLILKGGAPAPPGDGSAKYIVALKARVLGRNR